MKRAIALLLALIMAVSLVSLFACEKKDDDKKDDKKEEESTFEADHRFTEDELAEISAALSEANAADYKALQSKSYDEIVKIYFHGAKADEKSADDSTKETYLWHATDSEGYVMVYFYTDTGKLYGFGSKNLQLNK